MTIAKLRRKRTKMPESKEPRIQDAKNQRKNTKIKLQVRHDHHEAFVIYNLDFLWFLALLPFFFGSWFFDILL